MIKMSDDKLSGSGDGSTGKGWHIATRSRRWGSRRKEQSAAEGACTGLGVAWPGDVEHAFDKVCRHLVALERMRLISIMMKLGYSRL